MYFCFKFNSPQLLFHIRQRKSEKRKIVSIAANDILFIQMLHLASRAVMVELPDIIILTFFVKENVIPSQCESK